MRKILFGILLSVLMVFSSVADDITCGPGTESYTELEYIESTGTQYIDTKFVETTTTAVDTKLYIVSNSNNYLYGAQQNLDSMMYNGIYANKYLEYNWQTVGFTPSSLIEMSQSISGNLMTININGTQYTRNIGTSTSGARMYISACNGGNRKFSGRLRIYYFRIKNGSTIVRDFVPVRRNSDGAVGMYDRVNRFFYGNSGTGTFIAGPVIENMCFVCSDGYYNDTGNNTSCVACPTGYNATGDNATDHDSINDCKITCAPGYYVATSGGECVQAPAGYYAPNEHSVKYGETSNDVGGILQCPSGQTSFAGAVRCFDICDVGMEPYTELEYIESTGTQYIDTKFVETTTTAVDTKLYIVSNSNDYLYGAQPNSRGMMYNGIYANRSLEYNWQSVGFTASSLIEMSQSISGNLMTININGTQYTRNIGTSTSGARMYISACNGGNRKYSGRLRIYYFRIKNGSTIVRDFVPVRRNSDGAVGMYDRVNRVFYGNSGTGTFIAGPVIENMCPVCSDGYYNDTGNNTSCVACPAGYNATGDNATDHDNINDCKITCGGGFYLSSQYGTECIQTGVGYWSPSHTYGYGDTGIRNQCHDGLTTIGFGAGADEVGDCGMKFHVGNDALYLRSERKTSPTLNVEYGGRVFYGNMDPYTLPMSTDTTRKLHVEYNGVVYSVHDDSVGE